MPNALRISEAASLAMHTVVYLAARPEELASVGVIAGTLGASEAHLSKVMQRLAHGGIVRSIRGPKGGFALQRPADNLTLLEVYECIEGPLTASHCLLGKPVCTGQCILGNMMHSVNAEVREYLSSHRISQLIGTYVPEGKP